MNEPDLLAQDPVDVFEAGDAFSGDTQRLGGETATGVIDQEARRILDHDAGMPGRRDQRRQPVERRARGPDAADDFDDPHQRHRIEEMQAGDPLGMGGAGRDRGDRQRGRVGGEDRAGFDDAFERREERPLRIEPLDDRLDDDVAAGERGERIGRDDLGQQRGNPGRVEATPVSRSVASARSAASGAAS